MTDPVARLRALARAINAMRDAAKNWLDPSRPVIVGIDSDHFLRELDQAVLDLAAERASRMQVAP